MKGGSVAKTKKYGTVPSRKEKNDSDDSDSQGTAKSTKAKCTAKDIMNISSDTDVSDAATATAFARCAMNLMQGNITLLEGEILKTKGNRTINKSVIDPSGTCFLLRLQLYDWVSICGRQLFFNMESR